MMNGLIRKSMLLATTAVVLLSIATSLSAANLIYFQEAFSPGGRTQGLYNFNTATGISALRLAMPGAPAFWSLGSAQRRNCLCRGKCRP